MWETEVKPIRCGLFHQLVSSNEENAVELLSWEFVPKASTYINKAMKQEVVADLKCSGRF